METQKIVNLLNGSDNDFINDQNNGQYGEGSVNDLTIKFETKTIKSSLCDYSDAYILVTGNITAAGVNADTKVAFKNRAPFGRCVAHINDEHVETAENLNIIMPMYNLLEYCDNYADSSGSFWQFKRDELNIATNPDVTTDNSTFFKYKSNLFENPAAAGVLNGVKIAFPLKYVSNFFRSLEMPLINCKIHLELNWTKHCAVSTAPDNNNNNNNKTFQITSTKLYVPLVTLSTKDNVNLTKQLNEGFKKSVYWNEYKSKIEIKEANDQTLTRFPLDASFQGVNRFFVLAFNNTDSNVNQVERNSHRKYFLPREDITNYNVLIDGRNVYDQSINDLIKQYDEIRRIATGFGDNYTTGCLLDYVYFKQYYKLIAIDLSKRKELDADPRSIQQIEFFGMLKTNSQVSTVLEKTKETIFEFYRGTAKVLQEHVNG